MLLAVQGQEVSQVELAQVKLFSALNEEELTAAAARGRQVVYPGGATVFVRGQEADGLYVILSGRVKVVMLCPDGREKTLAILGPGEVLGEVALFGAELRSAGVETLETTTFLVISPADFRALLETMPALSSEVIILLAERLRRANRQIEELAFLNARSRVICALISLGEEHGRRSGEGVFIPLSLTHAEMAKLAGVTRETTTKALGDLQQSKFVVLARGSIRLPDLAGLKRELF